MTSVWLAGAENPQQHQYFDAERSPRVAFNVSAWMRNYRSRWSLGFSPVEWVAWTDTDTAPVEDLADAIDVMGSYPTYVIGPPGWSEARCYLPLWNGEGDQPRQFIESGLVITDAAFCDKSTARRVLASRRRNSVLGVITGKSLGVERFDLVISSAWWSVQKNGETQVWDGRKIRRYNAYSKDRVRTAHRSDIEALGVDAEQVLADNVHSLTVLAMRSWNALDSSSAPDDAPEAVIPALIDSPEGGSESAPLATTTGRPRHVLPVMQAFTKQLKNPLNGDLEESLVVTSTFESLRQCNNCYLADSCPSFSPDTSCAYSIPVEIRTKDQLESVMQAVLEIQTQRVLQARFSEEITGQELAPEVGREMDRLFTLSAKMQETLDSRESLKISVEAKGHGGGAGGALSRLFGAQVADNAKALPEPIDSDAVLAEVIDP
jgi:hypothetical protein